MLPGGGWAVAVACVLLLLAVAKAHGRQVRLVREGFGVLEVDFRGRNDERVEALWRRDRKRFWVSTAVTAAALLPLAWFAGLGWLPTSGSLALALALALAGGFLGAGLWTWAREGDERGAWGSFAWWTLATAALGLVALAAA